MEIFKSNSNSLAANPKVSSADLVISISNNNVSRIKIEDNKTINSIDKNVQSKNLSKDDIIKLSKEINEMSNKNIALNFTVDEKSGENIIQIIDANNKEVIKQIPSIEMLQVMKEIDLFLSKNKQKFPPGKLIHESV